MRLLLSRDTILPGLGIEVMSVVVNGPTPTPFINHPSLLGVWVETEDGRHAPVVRSSSASPTPPAQVEFTLPAHAVFAQRETFPCMRDAGYAPRGPERADCVVLYRLSQPGTYRVIARYDPPDGGRFAHPVIADTAALVVRDGSQ